MPEKFDFSKIEEQKKFEKLSEKGREEVVGVAQEEASLISDGTVKMDIAVAPSKGKANAELVKFLAGEFGVGKDKVKILSGHGERVKLVRVTRNA